MSAPKHTTQERQTRGAESDFDIALAARLLTDAAARAGAAIIRHYHRGTEVKLKADQSPVTQADKESEAIVLDALHRLAPETPVVSEEIAGERSAHLGPRFFLVDPLDGTKEFIQKRSDFTINIALVENGLPRFGLVYAPARSLLALTPKAGKAVEARLEPSEHGAELAKLECHPLHVRATSPEGLIAMVSRSHLDPKTEAFLAKLKIAGRSDAGSALKFLEVARGLADIYPRFGPTMEWDTAAGHAVLIAAGGYVEDADGKPLLYGKTEVGLRNSGFVAWGQRPAAS
ncbi:MAG TPA: 3'(2'),5'-bisphosphate nucleotidase CysQ [Methyloceanibacter sp.]|nr:3'(2'),5'-bisphosphate nucleotidase CysQ [Methyloceanibacter sp.]